MLKYYFIELKLDHNHDLIDSCKSIFLICVKVSINLCAYNKLMLKWNKCQMSLFEDNEHCYFRCNRSNFKSFIKRKHIWFACITSEIKNCVWNVRAHALVVSFILCWVFWYLELKHRFSLMQYGFFMNNEMLKRSVSAHAQMIAKKIKLMSR